MAGFAVVRIKNRQLNQILKEKCRAYGLPADCIFNVAGLQVNRDGYVEMMVGSSSFDGKPGGDLKTITVDDI